jgi:predicted DNA-binding protein (MmcQ/YjbR family)
MHNKQAHTTRQELYVVEVDGVQKSEHRIFVEALKCGMELKIRHPRSQVKLRDADDNVINGSHMAKRTWNIGRSFEDEHSAAWLRAIVESW